MKDDKNSGPTFWFLGRETTEMTWEMACRPSYRIYTKVGHVQVDVWNLAFWSSKTEELEMNKT